MNRVRQIHKKQSRTVRVHPQMEPTPSRLPPGRLLRLGILNTDGEVISVGLQKLPPGQ